MYRTLDTPSEDILAYDCTGTITPAEVREIHREAEAALESHDSLRILLRIHQLGMPEGKAILEDLKGLPTWATRVERYAVVGNRGWEELFTRAADTLTRAEARFFPPDRQDEAWEWIVG